MSLRKIISVLATKRIWLRSENGILRFSAPKGTMDQNTRELIGEYRSVLLGIVERYSPYRCLISLATTNQSSLIFIQKLAPYTSAYNVAVSFQLCAPLIHSAFESACHALSKDHTQLQSSFLPLNDTCNGELFLCQIIRESYYPEINYNDTVFRDIPTLRQAVVNDYKRRFDIENGPLIRWTVFNGASEDPVILMSSHHSIIDAWSLRIMVQDFFAEYSGNTIDQVSNKNTNISPQSFKYVDFAIHEQEQLLNGYFNNHRNFFGNRLKNYNQPLTLQSDYPRPAIAELSGSSIPFIISSDLYNKFTEFARKNGVTVNAVLLTGYMLLIYQECGQHRFSVGIPVSNRTNQLLNDVGYYVNTLAIPFQVDEILTYGESIKAVNETVEEFMEFQDFPFSHLVETLNPLRDASRSPIFQILFNFISRKVLGVASDFVYDGHQDNGPRILNGIKVKPFPIPQQEGQYDLTLEIIERNGFASGQLKYATALFSQSSAQRLIQHYLSTLTAIIDNPSDRIAENKTYSKLNNKQLVIAATFTAELITDSLDFWINRLNLDFKPAFAPNGQIIQQLLDPNSLFRTNDNGCNVILIRLDDLLYSSDKSRSLSDILSSHCDEILSAVTAVTVATSSTKAIFLIFFCPSVPDLMKDPVTKAIFEHIQTRYTELFNDLPGVYATAATTILSWYPVTNYHDPLRLENGHIPYTSDFYTAISTAIIRRLFVVRQKPVKIISVDCDNTLWSGVVAEDGAQNVTITDYHRDFHLFLSNQENNGKLLTLVSKNNEDDVNAVFSGNHSMLLKLSSIYSRRINWISKSENIRSLADEINIGLDGFLFIDDNPVECAEISGSLPQVLTVKFPSVPSDIPSFISSLWMLDNPKITSEDRNRSIFYHTEKQRNSMRSQTHTFAEFLDNLELEVAFEELNEHNGERLSQLTYRTNQFNFSDNKFSFQELCQLQSRGYDILAVSVKDRFGYYGIAGMTVCCFENSNATVDIFLLSCRVLGRGVEYQMINRLVKNALEKNVTKLHLQYKPTNRNRPALDFIENIAKQYPPSKLENGLVLDTLSGVPLFSAIAFTNDHDCKISPVRTINTASVIADNFSDELQKRNQRYYDIVENLPSLDKICAAVERYLQKYQTTSEVPFKTDHGAFPIESKIIEIWKKTLRVSTINSSINFFDLGGKSLQLPQVMADLEKAFGVKIMLVDLFKFTTVKALADYIQNKISYNDTHVKTESFDSTNKRFSGMLAMRQRQQQSRSNLNS